MPFAIRRRRHEPEHRSGERVRLTRVSRRSKPDATRRIAAGAARQAWNDNPIEQDPHANTPAIAHQLQALAEHRDRFAAVIRHAARSPRAGFKTRWNWRDIWDLLSFLDPLSCFIRSSCFNARQRGVALQTGARTRDATSASRLSLSIVTFRSPMSVPDSPGAAARSHVLALVASGKSLILAPLDRMELPWVPQIFMDMTMEPGIDYRFQLENRVESCDVWLRQRWCLSM